MSDPSWFEDDDPRRLATRVERIVLTLRQHASSRCRSCAGALCGHTVVMSIVAGHEDQPMCLSCLARETDRETTSFRDDVALFVQSKPCLVQGWRMASLTEGFAAEQAPSCLWPEGRKSPKTAAGTDEKRPSPSVEAPPEPDEHFDAGDQGCGDLVLALRIRLNAMAPGAILRLTATDPGAPEDIPSWCRLTGNRLVTQRHPDYFIERKES